MKYLSHAACNVLLVRYSFCSRLSINHLIHFYHGRTFQSFHQVETEKHGGHDGDERETYAYGFVLQYHSQHIKNCGIGYDRQHTVCHEEQQRASFQLESTEKRDSDERNQSQIHQIKKDTAEGAGQEISEVDFSPPVADDQLVAHGAVAEFCADEHRTKSGHDDAG